MTSLCCSAHSDVVHDGATPHPSAAHAEVDQIDGPWGEVLRHSLSSSASGGVEPADHFSQLSTSELKQLAESAKRVKTPLHFAMLRGKKGIHTISRLVDHGGVDPNAPDELGDTPLIYALRHAFDGVEQATHALLRAGADPNAPSSPPIPGEAVRPIHLACVRDPPLALKLLSALHQHGVHVEATTGDGRSALHIVARAPSKPTTDEEDWAHRMDEFGDMDDIDAHHHTMVSSVQASASATAGMPTRTRYRKPKASRRTGGQPSPPPTPGLDDECEQRYFHPETYVAEALLRIGANPLMPSQPPPTLEPSSTTPPHQWQYTPLQCAIEADNSRVVHVMLRHVAAAMADEEVSSSSVVDWPPCHLQRDVIHWCARYNSPLTAAMLLDQYQVDANAPSKGEHLSPLHYAAAWDALDAIVVLCSRGALVDAQTPLGLTPLHLAAGNDASKAIAALSSFGADVNATDGDGATPLHAAAETDSCNAASKLLLAGADPNARDSSHHRPLDLAMRNECSSVASLLRDASSTPSPSAPSAPM